jgi:hypothetical protein
MKRRYRNTEVPSTDAIPQSVIFLKYRADSGQRRLKAKRLGRQVRVSMLRRKKLAPATELANE